MRRLWRAVGDLPRPARWTLLGAGGIVLAALVAAGVWTLLRHREAGAARAFLRVSATSREALASGEASSLGQAAEGLKQFVKDHPRARVAAQAWYLLGNVEYQRRALDAAGTAFQEASRRDGGGVGDLSRLGLGYVFEAKGEPMRALDAYQQALKGRDAKHFLYGEILLAQARVQEELKQREAAIETYKRYLKELPGSSRADDAKARLAILGASSA